LATAWPGHSYQVMILARALFAPTVWIVIGVVVAAVYDYFDNLDTVGQVLSAIAAVVVWPVLLFGFDIEISR
jgi:hypothetical protein